MKSHSTGRSLQMLMEFFLTLIFLAQACARVSLAPTFQQVYSDSCFWLEVCSILPNLFMYALAEAQRHQRVHCSSCWTLLTILRSFRIFRFARQITGLRVFLRSLVFSLRDLFHLFIILIAMILFFGELIYLIEEWTSDSSIETVTGRRMPWLDSSEQSF